MKRAGGSKKLVAGLVFAGFALGCAAHPALLGPDARVPHNASRGRTIEAGECGFNLSAVIGTSTPSVYQRAARSLRAQAPFDYVTDIEMLTYHRYVVIGTRHCVRLRATAYPKIAEAPAPPPILEPEPADAAPSGDALTQDDADPVNP